MKARAAFWLFAALAATQAGCMGQSRYLAEATPAGGSAQQLAVPADEALDLAVEVCADRGFSVVSVDEAGRTVRASAKAGFSASGFMMKGMFGAAAHEHVAIFVKPAGANGCEVTVKSLGDDGKPTSRNWPGKILADLRAAAATKPPNCFPANLPR